MPTELPPFDVDQAIAARWCEAKGAGWTVGPKLGQGATANVYEVSSPDGLRALKIYDAKFSGEAAGQIEKLRIDQQVTLRDHTCPSMVQVFDGGEFENRLFLVMSRPAGQELEKRLADVPRDRIRTIMDQIAKAVLFLRDKELCHRDIKAANIVISDDFSQATLLDLSVTRLIHDPAGLGTDAAGHLPIVATARYSPPEYLFRLLEPGLDLWNALDVYQLGGLLHDLIMREPLFQAEYLQSKTNRYRFAWIVATVNPRIEASEVSPDLVFLARQALAKDWQRRSNIRVEDFLARSEEEQARALALIGLTPSTTRAASNGASSVPPVTLKSAARDVETTLIAAFRGLGIRTVHRVEPVDGGKSFVVTLTWDRPSAGESPQLDIRLDVKLRLAPPPQQGQFESTAELVISGDDNHQVAARNLANTDSQPDSGKLIADQVLQIMGRLARDLGTAPPSA